MILKEKIRILQQSFEAREASPEGPLFTNYDDYGSKAKPAPDPLWLEETKKGAVPFAIRDEDGDGFYEINQVSLGVIVAKGLARGPFRLASYFDDRKSAASFDLEVFKIFMKTPDRKFSDLESLAKSKDLEGTSQFFGSLAKGEENPLFKIRPFLRVFLDRIALHSGFGLGDGITFENNPNGFSVASDGRWRIDCVLFAQLSHEVLKGVTGLEFSYIYLRSEKPRMAHVVMLVSETKEGGRHLLIDNERVIYFEAKEPEDYLTKRYTEQGYEVMARGGDEWNPRAKARRFYPVNTEKKGEDVLKSDILGLVETFLVSF